jgi:osmotically inducible protein OsmC
MPVRNAEAVWEGSLREGKGTMQLGSGAFEGKYSFQSRFEEGAGTNPEELIGAAHAGCFSMAFSGNLGRAGYTPERIHTTAKVPGIDRNAFLEQAEAAKAKCPVSQALTGVEITLEAKLVG